jgi:hypothetical protein
VELQEELGTRIASTLLLSEVEEVKWHLRRLWNIVEVRA